MSRKIKIKVKQGKAKIKLKSGDGALPLGNDDIKQLLGAAIASVAATPPALVVSGTHTASGLLPAPADVQSS